jgi:antirestriction protein
MQTVSEQATRETPRVWIGCLGCYNAGALVGAWIDATEGEDYEPHDAIGGDAGFDVPPCGRIEGSDERWVFDHEGFGGFLTGECSPSEAQRIAEGIAEVPDYVELAAVSAWAEDYGPAEVDLSDLSDFEDAYQGTYDSEQDFAQELAEEIGAIPEDLAWPMACIDWGQATRELFMDYWSASAPGGGVYVFRR